MEKETFTMRKNFLREYFKKRIVFYIENEENDGFNSSITYTSNILNCEWYNKHFIKKLKEFTYYHLSKCLNENKNLDIISIEMFVPYEDINDETLINPTFNESMLLHERIRVLKLEKLPETTFLGMFDYIHILYIDEHEFILHPTKNFKFLIKCKTCKKKNIISLPKCFKSDECVICLNKQPNVLFCNCGHIPICTECSKIKKFTECPVCKTKNEIVRIIE